MGAGDRARVRPPAALHPRGTRWLDRRDIATRPGQDPAVRQHADIRAVLRLRRHRGGRSRSARGAGGSCRRANGQDRGDGGGDALSGAGGQWLAGRTGPVRDLSQADRGGQREEHEGDPAQAAGDGAQGHPERPYLGLRPGCGGAAPDLCGERAKPRNPRIRQEIFPDPGGGVRGLPGCDHHSGRRSGDRLGNELLFPR